MLNEHIFFGVSKHAIKQQRIKESKENNTPYKPIKGIFSKTTLKTYQKACEQFSTYLRTKHPEVKRFENGKPYIEEWLESLKDSHSAWTLATYGSGVACAFNISKKDIEFDFPVRGRENISRSRDKTSYKNSDPSFAELNRIIIEEYISFLRTKAGISSQLLAKRLGSLSTFLDFCKIRKIPNTPLITLIDSNDYCTKVQYEQQPYSDNEMKQIMANINKLKNQQLARMVFCLSEIACRPSEFCSLRPADLIKDKDDKYSLTINANKNKNIYTVPVSNMVALILEAAITESKEQYGEDVKYIFAASHDDFIRTTSLDYYLKQLSVENNIIDDAGNILHITFHRFRTTRASKYLQQGMDADVISLLLGHKVKNTLKHYAKASNKEILNALKPLMDKYEQMINNIGNMSAMKDLSTNTIPLPNGRCSKAVATGICDHANHCLSCSMFIPKPEFLLGYKRQLAEVEAAINLATESDAPRLLEYNTMLKKQLENIIKQCEEDENEKV